MARSEAQKRYYARQKELREMLGTCRSCGEVQGQGSSGTLCKACRERQRAADARHNDAHREDRQAGWRTYRQQVRAARRDAGLCPACGKAPPLPGRSRCARCAEASRGYDAKKRDKERMAESPRYTGDPKTYGFRLGAERPKLDGKVHVLRFALDAWSYFSILKLIAAMRDEERAAGQAVRRDGISLLVRQCILQHERSPCPVHRQTDEKHEHRLGVSLDDRTLALLDAHAARHYPVPEGAPEGTTPNRSAALRDFLIAAKPRPKWVAKVGGARRYPDVDDDVGDRC